MKQQHSLRSEMGLDSIERKLAVFFRYTLKTSKLGRISRRNDESCGCPVTPTPLEEK